MFDAEKAATMAAWSAALAKLNEPLNSRHVKKRTQAGATLSYVEGWHVIGEANRIFGHDGWDSVTLEVEQVCRYQRKDRHGKDQIKVGYRARVAVTALGRTRQGTGFGSGIAADECDAVEKAIKEAETDALKRALRTFGNVFGLTLYDKDQANVVDDDAIDARPARALRYEATEARRDDNPATPMTDRIKRYRDRLADARSAEDVRAAAAAYAAQFTDDEKPVAREMYAQAMARVREAVR